jgi:hypothetical protein
MDASASARRELELADARVPAPGSSSCLPTPSIRTVISPVLVGSDGMRWRWRDHVWARLRRPPAWKRLAPRHRPMSAADSGHQHDRCAPRLPQSAALLAGSAGGFIRTRARLAQSPTRQQRPPSAQPASVARVGMWMLPAAATRMPAPRQPRGRRWRRHPTAALSAGDAILLKCGGTWRESLQIGGKATAPCRRHAGHLRRLHNGHTPLDQWG